MKGIQVKSLGGPKVLEVCDDLPIPDVSNTEVLVKIFAAGVNPVDTYIRSGQFAYQPNLPYTPGKDGAGVIEKVGENVTRLKKGQRVFICVNGRRCGTYAEYAVADESDTFLLDSCLSYEQGASIGIPYFTAYRAIFQKGRAVPGETILVHGASGAVGLACVQLGKLHGLHVIGTAGTSEGMELVKNNGASHVLCHREKDHMDKLMELTENKGVNIIVEMLANINLGKDLKVLAPLGRVLIVGCRGNVNIDPRDTMLPEIEIIGVALFSSTKEEWSEIAKNVLKGLEEKKLIPVVDKYYTLEECSKAHTDIINSKGAKGKLVISINSH